MGYEHYDYDGTEADYLADQEDWIGGYVPGDENFDEDFEEDFDEDYEEERQRKLNRLRSQRINAQKGKYIIVGYAHNREIYLQDKNISRHGYWTKYRANARVFDTKEAAEKVNAFFKFNSPHIVKV